MTKYVHTLTGVTIHQIDACNLQIPTKTNRGKSLQVVNQHQESDQGAREEERETSIDRQIYETFGDDDDCGMCDEDLGE